MCRAIGPARIIDKVSKSSSTNIAFPYMFVAVFIGTKLMFAIIEVEAFDTIQADGLVKSETLNKEFPILLGNAVTARLKTGNKMPKGYKTKYFLPQIFEQLLEIDPNLFRATPEQEKQFADGKFDDKKTGKRIDATIKQLSKLKVVVPWMSQYLLDQYQTGKVSGARLELTARMLNLNVIQTKKDQEKP